MNIKFQMIYVHNKIKNMIPIFNKLLNEIGQKIKKLKNPNDIIIIIIIINQQLIQNINNVYNVVPIVYGYTIFTNIFRIITN